VISLNNVYRSLEEKVIANDRYGVAFETARIVRIFTYFEPIVLVNDDVIYDPDSNEDIPDPDVSKKDGKGGRSIPDALYLERSNFDHLEHSPLINMIEFFTKDSTNM